MFSGKHMNSDKRQRGMSLVTLALLLLLIGGALMAGIAYFRASIPSDVASSQKDAMNWADQAVLGFASTQHRLPCPAATPTGDEDCSLAKGWLPAKALNLDATMFQPGLLPMKYMVYRNKTTVNSKTYAHRDLAANESVSSRTLPLDAYEPPEWDNDATQDYTDITDTSAHTGRFTARKDFNVRNGLDLCETARLAYSEVLHAPSNAYAHYLRGSTVVNVAYGIAEPGMGDASGNNNPFDGVNANDAAIQMEPPDLPHSSDYNDYVFVRDLPSYMAALGCPPVHYNMVEGYTENVAKGTFGGLKDFSSEITPITSTFTDNVPPSELIVAYEREGVAALTVSSVDSVALMVDAAAEVEALRAFVADNANSTMDSAIQQDITTAIGIITAVVGLAANVAAIVKAVTAAIASLGADAGADTAIGLYVAGLAVSVVAVGLSIAAEGMLIAATVYAANVVSAVGGDTSLISTFCDKAQNLVDKATLLKNLNDQRASLVTTRDNAQAARDAAKAKYDAVTNAINACYNGLSNNEPQVTMVVSTPSGNTTVTCTATQSDARTACFDTASLHNAIPDYASFRDLSLYQAQQAAQQNLDVAQKNLADLNSKIAELQDTSSIDDVVNTYRNALIQNNFPGDIDAQVAAYRANLEQRRQDDLAAAISQRDALNAQISALQAARDAATAAVTNAQNALQNASTSDVLITCTAPNSGTGTAACQATYNNYCSYPLQIYDSLGFIITETDLRYAILTPRFQVAGERSSCGSSSAVSCAYPYYYSVWLEYQEDDQLYQTTVTQIAVVDSNIQAVNNMDFSSCASGSDHLLLWSVDDATEVLRRVDKRGVLQ